MLGDLRIIRGFLIMLITIFNQKAFKSLLKEKKERKIKMVFFLMV